jgi:glycosyltransferase involved in cell wall biosynthesis
MESTPLFNCVDPESLAHALRTFTPSKKRGPRNASKPLKILHLLSQRPGWTGSGVALLALVRQGGQAGYLQRAVIGLPGDAPLPEIPPLTAPEIFAVRFNRSPVPFALPGMSDFMPYVSTRFSTFNEEMLEGYLQVFSEALSAAVKDFEPDIIQSNHLWLLTALARVRFPTTPLCVYSHGTELRQLLNAAHLAPFVIPACAAVDAVLALHEDDKAKVGSAYGIAPRRIHIAGVGFCSERFRPDAACTPASERETLIIAYAGKISSPKGVPWLIEAMRRVEAPVGKKVKLLLMGSSGNKEAEAIRRQAADQPNVVFLGALPQQELAAVLRSADVFVLPSFFEGLPLVVIEALACGCRVVMTDLPGLDSWMPAGLCEEGVVERVRMPRLIGADTPVPEALPRFVQDLALALNRQLNRSVACGSQACAPERLTPLSWQQVYARIQPLYHEITAAPISS